MRRRLKDNRSYYDAFSERYEQGRDAGYHALVDALTVDLVLRYGRGKDVLEVGCGTGLILKDVAGEARRAMGVDLSAGMLRRSHERGLRVAQGDATSIPFASESFDVVCSFKVLPHVRDLAAALAEMARLLRPGGVLLLEFYNRRSLRYLVKRTKRPTSVAEGVTDEEVHPLRRCRVAAAPRAWESAAGIRIARGAVVHIPLLRNIFSFSSALCDSPLRGVRIVVVRKEGGAPLCASIGAHQAVPPSGRAGGDEEDAARMAAPRRMRRVRVSSRAARRTAPRTGSQRARWRTLRSTKRWARA
jgi:ubiquinone/menaquinone biosynthesis C-methylase UbiE